LLAEALWSSILPAENMPRVLIVDDSPEFRHSIGARLERTGHEIIFASDGGEALAHLQRENVDLILLDYHMPVWDGVESMVLFKHNRVKSPVIAYTCKDRRSTMPFESVMLTLGTLANIRCDDGTEELIEAAEQFLSPKTSESKSGKDATGKSQTPVNGYPKSIDWRKVRMLSFSGLKVTLVLEEESLEYSFDTRERMDDVLNKWFRNA
jgi:CheY-like chemotaxis protein